MSKTGSIAEVAVLLVNVQQINKSLFIYSLLMEFETTMSDEHEEIPEARRTIIFIIGFIDYM